MTQKCYSLNYSTFTIVVIFLVTNQHLTFDQFSPQTTNKHWVESGNLFFGVENTLCLSMQARQKRMHFEMPIFVAGECAEGFQMGDEDSSCTPINQCLLNTSPCHSNATCNFLGPGTFQCICNQGFAGNGTHCYRKSFKNDFCCQVKRYFSTFQLFAKPAVKMEAFVMVLTIVPVLRALKALNAKLTLTNVLLDLVFINVPLIPFVSINLDGNFLF